MATPFVSQQNPLDSLLVNLRSKNEDVRTRAAKNLHVYVEAEARDVSGESFSKFMNDLIRRIFELVNSNDTNERLGGIMAIDELIDVDVEENPTKITRFANYLRMVLTNTSDTQTLLLASSALGHLARVGGTLTADVVEFEVKRALEWLQSERYESRRGHAGVLVLKELAENAPTLFYVHVGAFFDNVWVTVRDSKQHVREAAIDALRACLCLIAERESKWRLQWYCKIFEEAQKGLKAGNADSIHGSLLTIGELLRNSEDFMYTRFTEACDIVLRYKDHKNSLVKKTVVQMVPVLANFSPEAFIKGNYLIPCLNHLLGSLRSGTERPAAYLAIGEMAPAVGDSIIPHLDPIINLVKEGLTPRRGRPFVQEALTCVSMLAKAVGPALTDHMQPLFEQMFSMGLSPVLMESLSELGESIPLLLAEIQSRVLGAITKVLTRPYAFTPLSHTRRVSSVFASPIGAVHGKEEPSDSQLITLALNTLGTFDFRGHNLIDLIRETVVDFVDDDAAGVRKEAAMTCCKLLVPPGETAPTRGRLASVVGEVLEKLLITAISDPEPDIRKLVLESLDERFDQHLCQADNLRSLFLALNDEVFEIREVAITVIGRLTVRNPAYVMPSLRKYLIQLMTELEFSGDTRNKEEAAHLLEHLIRSCQRLIKPYVSAVTKALIPKLRDSASNVAQSVMATVGELSCVGGEEMVHFLRDLLPITLDMLQDQSSASKREVALISLGKLIESSGYVLQPYAEYPKLLDVIINLMKSEQSWSIRREAITDLGILGALDPHRHTQVNQLLSEENAGDSGAPSAELAGPELVHGMGPSSEDFFPSVAINALLAVLRDTTLSTHHNIVIQGLMYIFKSLGLKSVPFLPQVMPAFVSTMRSCEHGLRDFLFQQLGLLVSIVKGHIKQYLDEILSLIQDHWQTSNLQIQIVTLIEEVSNALQDEFKVYLPKLLPQLLNILHTDRSARRAASLKVLHALEVFGTNLEDYVHLIIPAMVRLLEQLDAPLNVRHETIKTLGRLCRKLNFADFASRIVLPLARLLDGEQGVELANSVMDTLCSLVYHIGSDYAVFVPLVNKVLVHQQKWISHPRYDNLVTNLLKNLPLPPEPGETDEGGLHTEPDEAPNPEYHAMKKLPVNQQHLKRAWETSQRSTKDDWNEWMRRFSVELLKESPSPPLRSCSPLAQVYHPMARELFNAGFVSCWTELDDAYRDSLVLSIETALLSPNIPPEILQTLLNLAEFMEHDEKQLPIDIRTLGALAEKCHAYAKALHYKELEFQTSPQATIEALISINNQLQQPEAAVGILVFAQQYHGVELKESWYEKLQRWEDALEAYERRSEEELYSQDVTLGRMRCLNALGEWEQLAKLAKGMWRGADAGLRRQVAHLAASAAWNLHQWDDMSEYTQAMDSNSVEGSFFRAILAVHQDAFKDAQRHIDHTRELLDTELGALVGESYNRAYRVVVRVQQLAELEEIIQYKEIPDRRFLIHRMWTQRLVGCQRHVDVWQRLLAVHSLVIPCEEDMDMWLKFSSLCLKSGRLRLSHKTLLTLLGMDPSASERTELPPGAHPNVCFAMLKHLWACGHKDEAVARLETFVNTLDDDERLRAKCYLKMGEWNLAKTEGRLQERDVKRILRFFQQATDHDPESYRAWHSWALTNFEVVAHLEKEQMPPKHLNTHVTSAVRGFFRSISLGGDRALQDILRLLTLWFKHGALPDVEAALLEGFNTVAIDTWLQVIPQLIARIHTPSPIIRRIVHELLVKVGKEHPQALIYPLMVASKSQSTARQESANAVISQLHQHWPALMEQALMVSQELIRVAILWHEMWHEALEEASRHYFGDHNVEAMFQVLFPLHQMMERGPETLRESSFQNAFGRDLQEAFEWCKKYTRSRKESDMNQAWDLYYQVFRRMNKQLPQITLLDLQYVSPKLLGAKELELAVPGTYRSQEPVIRIHSFATNVKVITSKQRPRKLVINGSDGKQYVFLLKGHEDIRQDERVMQLFGLVNMLLNSDRETSKRDLAIQRMPVIPLAPNSGLIGWVPHSDTLHQLIREYREARKILLNIEHRLMLQVAPDFDNLTLMQKVEVFEYALDNTQGQDLNKVLWLKSRNSEVWLDRRNNYTRSLATMNMVGYVLGLGDRHPSNLMLDRVTGKIIHIDFGDCFEVAMHREKFPEKIPFRLTRMLINAMEVSGIEGTFRFTCENVLRVLRDNKDSVMAMLEAFVYDPLINWRLLTTTQKQGGEKGGSSKQHKDVNYRHEADILDAGGESPDVDTLKLSHSQHKFRDRRPSMLNEDGEAPQEALNERAVQVMNRVSLKLTGRDFGNETLGVEAQVRRLVKQATLHENLCQCYIGWCPFW